MRGIWLRRLLPASVVSVVLALSYFAPAEGLFAPPVKTHDTPSCGRSGYGYHGPKHNFGCVDNSPPPGVISSSPLPRAIVGSPGVPQPPGNPTTNSARPGRDSSSPAAQKNNVVTRPVSVDVTDWRNFAEFLLRQLSSR
jgi:hypothetical protein